MSANVSVLPGRENALPGRAGALGPLADEALHLVREAADAAREAGELPRFLGELERVRVEALVSATAPAKADPPTRADEKTDQLLSVAETAKRIDMSPWWVRANKDALPIVRLPGGRYKFSEKRLERWIGRRAS